MSFQSYLINIRTKTGNSAEDFIRLATDKGFMENETLKPGIKAGQIVQWLKDDYDLGHGHAMAVYAYLKGKRN
ncbi:DUF4287 domain-containing protein [Sinomicrobium pectinilyticum]|uniref:DUF4287 domain-containing protein n=1 Tax=Sinomicrobium pectinilyticum TaxID=1084421 RepID=A0A3N0ETU9_SINP1|nr:DUF4287 domain-containing protein [Sinomicrobium pectinilyticum]RNL91323.1 DUF4287 domain-containing protein [Sinomicrobium pectinilyticum]